MAEYQVWLKDYDGSRIAIFAGTGRETGGLQSLRFEKLLRHAGQCIVEIDGTDERIEYFQTDCQVEVWRQDTIGGLSWYKVFEAFHRGDEWRQDESGRDIYVSTGQHYNILLTAEPIRYASGSIYVNKSGPCETVAKEYTDENIGPSATSPPRDSAGVMPGLTIEADGATGADWEGGRANKNLLDVLVELADYAPADFMIVGTGAATFEFQWRESQWGEDRTWGNAAGIPAVVFDPLLGNCRNVLYTYDRTSETNVCYVLGQGAGEDRRVVTRTSGAETDSPWNRRAVARDARNTYETDALNDKGDDVLDKSRARVRTQVDVAQTTATRFGRDWDIGDLVTVHYRDISVNQKIIGARVEVSNDGSEVITAMMEDYTYTPISSITPTPEPEPESEAVAARALYVQASDCATAAGTNTYLDLAVDAGCDTVIYAAYYGRAYWNSDIMPVQVDALTGVMAGAATRGLNVWAWLPCAYMAWGSHPEWNAKNNHADIDEDWLDFEVPAARAFLASAYAEIVNRYAVDGVLLDYIRWRSSWWLTADLSPDDISLTVSGIHAAVKAIRPIPVTAAVYRSQRSCRHARQHWWEWLAGDYLDVASPMAYVNNTDELQVLMEDWTETGWYPSQVYPSLRVYMSDSTLKTPAQMSNEFTICEDALGFFLFDNRRLALTPTLVSWLGAGGW